MNTRDHQKLGRQSSVGQSSRIHYYRKAEGVPFQWEKKPGTPKNQPIDDHIIPPLSPPPSLQNLALPKPCFNIEPQQSKPLKLWILKKMHRLKTELMHGDQSDAEFVATSFNNSSSSSFSSSTDSFASNIQERESMEQDEGNLMKMHRRAYSESYYGSTQGIPFKWELHPGTPINLPLNEIIPPPSPPPILQTLALPKPSIDQPHHQPNSSTCHKLLCLFIKNKKQKERLLQNNEPSFRLETWDRLGDSVLFSASSSSSITKKNVLTFSKFTRDFLRGNFCFNPCNIKANLASASSRRRI